jgi:hypothetical protein
VVVLFAADEAWDALLGVNRRSGTAVAVAGGGSLCFLLCFIQMTAGASSIQMKNNSHFSF